MVQHIGTWILPNSLVGHSLPFYARISCALLECVQSFVSDCRSIGMAWFDSRQRRVVLFEIPSFSAGFFEGSSFSDTHPGDPGESSFSPRDSVFLKRARCGVLTIAGRQFYSSWPHTRQFPPSFTNLGLGGVACWRSAFRQPFGPGCFHARVYS